MRMAISSLFFIACLFAAAVSSHSNQWILYHDKEINGAVVEVKTGKPIEEAIVIAMWALSQVPGDGFGGYANVEVVLTNKEGKFTVPSWIRFKPWKIIDVVHDLAPEIIIYKPGYGVHSSHKLMRAGYPDDYSMTPEQKKQDRDKYGITPAKLNKIYTDEDKDKNVSALESEAHFPGHYYSKAQRRLIYDAIGIELISITNEYNNKLELIKSFQAMRKFWVEGIF